MGDLSFVGAWIFTSVQVELCLPAVVMFFGACVNLEMHSLQVIYQSHLTKCAQNLQIERGQEAPLLTRKCCKRYIQK